MAKCLNCEVGISSSPCNKCSACIEVDKGCFIDLIEIDSQKLSFLSGLFSLFEDFLKTRKRFTLSP